MIKDTIISQTKNPSECESREELRNSVNQHRFDVANVMDMLGEHIRETGELHDWTKVDFFDDFYRDSIERISNPNFKERDWFDIHCNYEGHHLNSKVPEDVDLFNVLESIVDCIVTAKSQGKELNPYFLIIRRDVLKKAYWNTVRKLDDSIVLKED